jgi:O-antigen/teichoic acid export membrane protein
MTSNRVRGEDAANRAVRGGVVSGFSLLLGLLMGVLIPFIALRFWSGEQLGLWMAAIGWMSLWSLIDYSHQTYVGNAYTVDFLRGAPLPTGAITTALWMAAALGVGKILFLILVIAQFPDVESLVLAVPLIFVQGISSGLMGILMQMFRPHGLYATGVLFSLGSQVLSTAAALLVILIMQASPAEALFAFAAVKLVTESIVVLHAIKRFRVSVHLPGKTEWRTGLNNLLGSGAYVVNTAMESGVTQGSVVLLERLAGGFHAGYFATVRTLANVVLQNVNFFVLPIAHDFVRLAEARDRVGFRAVVGGASILLAGAISAFAALIVLIGEPVFQMWTKGQFGSLWEIVPWLAGAAFLRTAIVPAYVFFQQLNMTGVLNSCSALRVAGFLVVIITSGPSANAFALAAFVGECCSSGYLMIRWHCDSVSKAVGGSWSTLLPAVSAATICSFVLLGAFEQIPALALILIGCLFSVLSGLAGLEEEGRRRLRANVSRLMPHFESGRSG